MKKFPNILDLVVIVAFLAGVGYVYAGFIHADQTFFRLFPDGYKVLKACQLYIPIMAVGAVYLYWAVRAGRMGLSRLALVLGGVLLLALLMFLVSDIRYGRAIKRNMVKYHAMLQLTPPTIKDHDAGRFNVVCLGGSTTDFRDKTGRDWPSMTEKKLRLADGFRDVRFYNMGKQWYTTQQILTNYIQNVRPFKPQAIIVMENINDLLLNADFSLLSHGVFREDYGHFMGPSARLASYGSYSSFLQGFIKNVWYRKPPAEILTDRFPGLDVYERNIRTIIALARLDGTRVVLMTQPNIYKDVMPPEEMKVLAMLNVESSGRGQRWAYRTALSGLRQYNDRMRKIAADERVPLIDLEKVVPKSLEYFYDDVHYKDKTYDLIADFLAGELKGKLK
ncbi:MAG: SGNH/GDSL hydrolase family protein [Candidatus Omnitrophica bacterium]|nr:SGNH/GDSL hydrolase family protein [Candidatus Omnitrophota bacterium]